MNFKEVYKTITACYEIDTEWTTTDLYNNMTPLILRDFNINNFELLDTITHFDGKTEEKPKIEPNDITLDQLYGIRIKHVAFYIRVP